jgi:hypothetical protein
MGLYFKNDLHDEFGTGRLATPHPAVWMSG